MKHYLEETEKVLAEVKSTANGITSAEAEKRLAENGKNKLKEAEKESLFKKFLSSLADPMIIMLMIAAAIQAIVAVVETSGKGASIADFADVLIILVVVIINTILSLVQESKAEAAMEALMQMTAATSRVIRDGIITVVKSEDLVVGDVIVLEAGDAVPADCRVLESFSMKVEEAALTGESVPVTKAMAALGLKTGVDDVSLGDRKNMVYSGSTIVYGRGKAVVTAVGMETEMGKIADALSTAEKEQTPLQIKMAEISKVLTKLVVGICIFIFAYGIISEIVSFSGGFHFEIPTAAEFGDIALGTFILAVALAVAAIPEGLPAVVTIILSIGVTSMSKRQALIRKLTAVETLGCTQIICSDKTGTLTQNKMTVVDHYGDNEKLLATAMALCCDANIDDKGVVTGEPTEAALVAWANKLSLNKNDLVTANPRVGEAPFDSGRKMMSTVHNTEKGIVQYTKGAPDVVLNLCTHALINGNIVPMTDEIKNTILGDNKRMADKALRVLACAMRVYESTPADFEAANLEKELVFIGLSGMIDPCRPEVKSAIEECRSAGIRPIMITGDHKDTAVAIAKELGIITEASEAILGADLEKLSDEELMEAVPKYSVYARVQPEHKTRIVRAWKARGMVTAMTGDGVNDAPSIKASDIGIGMGITGTDVTKGVADMVLADDNFATIVNAVEEGRKIYDNVRKVLGFQLSTNMAEILVMFTASIMKISMLSAPHLLWINMVTDSVPGLALGMEKAESNLMKKKPRKANESVFANGVGVDLVSQGFFLAALVIFSYFLGVRLESEENRWILPQLGIGDMNMQGTTMAFLTMNFMEVFKAICMRSQHGSLFKMKKQNWWLWGAFGLASILTLVVVSVPALADTFKLACLFSTNPETLLTLEELCIAFGLGFLVVPGLEIIKVFLRLNDKRLGRTV